MLESPFLDIALQMLSSASIEHEDSLILSNDLFVNYEKGHSKSCYRRYKWLSAPVVSLLHSPLCSF